MTSRSFVRIRGGHCSKDTIALISSGKKRNEWFPRSAMSLSSCRSNCTSGIRVGPYCEPLSNCNARAASALRWKVAAASERIRRDTSRHRYRCLGPRWNPHDRSPTQSTHSLPQASQRRWRPPGWTRRASPPNSNWKVKWTCREIVLLKVFG